MMTLHVVSTAAVLRSLRQRRGAPARTAARVLARLYDDPGRVVTMAELIESAYSESRDGGAEAARGVIKTTLMRLRRAGVPVATVPHRRGYRVPARAP
jgi:DNA-binding response OmpR family regulator